MNRFSTIVLLLLTLLITGCGLHTVSGTDESVMLSGLVIHSEQCAEAEARSGPNLVCHRQWRAAEIADTHCRQYGKQAQWQADTVPDGYTTYKCVK